MTLRWWYALFGFLLSVHPAHVQKSATSVSSPLPAAPLVISSPASHPGSLPHAHGNIRVVPPVPPAPAVRSNKEASTVPSLLSPPANNTGEIRPGVFLNPPPAPPPAPSPREDPATVQEFHAWADTHGIILQGIQKKINDLYYNKYDSASDAIAVEGVPHVTIVYAALKRLPDNVLQIMRDKTVYVSTVRERPYTVWAGEYGGVMKGIHDGIILTQPLSEWNTIHEFGHIVAGHGIEGLYGRAAPWSAWKQPYHHIFEIHDIIYPPPTLPAGYMTIYATANIQEDFAEHFSAYVLDAEQFRKKAEGDTLLKEKYLFLETNIFAGKEY